MATDDERREVAERLRELGKLVYSPDNTYELMADALGVDDFEGTDELFARLADLIEPSCDREALLALADCVRGMGEEYDRIGAFGIAVALKSISDRVREACGEAVA